MITDKGTSVGDKSSATDRLITDDKSQNVTLVTFVRLFML